MLLKAGPWSLHRDKMRITEVPLKNALRLGCLKCCDNTGKREQPDPEQGRSPTLTATFRCSSLLWLGILGCYHAAPGLSPCAMAEAVRLRWELCCDPGAREQER